MVPQDQSDVEVPTAENLPSGLNDTFSVPDFWYDALG